MTTFEGELRRVDVERVGPPEVIAEDVALMRDFPLGPSDRRPAPVSGREAAEQGLWVMEADGSGRHQLIAPDPSRPHDPGLRGPVGGRPMGPGSRSQRSPAGLSDQRRIYVANADGSERPSADGRAGDLGRDGPRSGRPTGRAIAFNRWEQDPETRRMAGPRRSAIAPVDGGPAVDRRTGAGTARARSSTTRPTGSPSTRSPDPSGDDPAYDDTKVLAIDPVDGSTTELDWPTGMVPTWQRTAIEP